MKHIYKVANNMQRRKICNRRPQDLHKNHRMWYVNSALDDMAIP